MDLSKGILVHLQLTWLGQSGLRIERNGFRLVIDAGALSAPDAVQGADALLITHEHLDHYDTGKIAAAVAARPGLPIWTNKSVAALLEQSGAGSGARVHVVGDGDAFELGGIPVHVHGEWHAVIHPDIPVVGNIGFMIDGRLFHPGDALIDPGTHIELLLMPIHGLYTKCGPLVDYIRHLKPSRVSPIHDATLSATGQTGEDAFFAQNPGGGPGTGSPYYRPPAGQPIDF
jgi:L-ascorbate metabolism protein UlaG (beta-lactamase superfamily)